jgi:hypothetical protein
MIQIIFVVTTVLCSGCTDSSKQLYNTAINEFERNCSIRTLLEKHPKEAEAEIKLYAGGSGWSLTHSTTEIINFQKTGNFKCPFMANQTYFLSNLDTPDSKVLVSILWLWNDGWRIISACSEKYSEKNPRLRQEIVSFNIWDKESNPDSLQ